MLTQICNNLTQDNLPKIINFFKENHGVDHVMSHEIMLNYFFLDEKLGVYRFIAALSGEEIIGILGYLPAIFEWGGVELEGVWTSHWTVAENFRNGVGVLLMKRLQELYPIVAGQGANKLNKQIVTKMGHHFFDHIPRTIKINDPGHFSEIFPKCNITHLQPDLKNTYLPTAKVIAQVLENFTKQEYEPNWDLYGNHSFGTKRNFKYIKEKYIDHPVFQYKFILNGTNASPYLIVFRLESTSGRAEFNCIRILEVIYPTVNFDKRKLTNAFDILDVFATNNNAVFTDFYCTNNNIQEQVLQFGFSLDGQRIVPNLLNPIVERARDQNLELYLNGLDVPKWDLMYFTKSDGDQDRPNTVNLQKRL